MGTLSSLAMSLSISRGGTPSPRSHLEMDESERPNASARRICVYRVPVEGSTDLIRASLKTPAKDFPFIVEIMPLGSRQRYTVCSTITSEDWNGSRNSGKPHSGKATEGLHRATREGIPCNWHTYVRPDPEVRYA